jgi:hypothetical protein
MYMPELAPDEILMDIAGEPVIVCRVPACITETSPNGRLMTLLNWATPAMIEEEMELHRLWYHTPDPFLVDITTGEIL